MWFGSRVGGRVAAVHVREGQLVEHGTVMVTFGAPELTARRDQVRQKLASAVAAQAKANHGPLKGEGAGAKAAADAAKARYEMMTAGYRYEEKRQAESELEAALADQTLTEKEYARIQQLQVPSATERDAARVVILHGAGWRELWPSALIAFFDLASVRLYTRHRRCLACIGRTSCSQSA